jgi:plastocyanin
MSAVGLSALAFTAMLWSVSLIRPSTAKVDDPNRVVVKNFMFEPMSLSTAAGSTVIWTNLDDQPHAVMGDSGVFRSGALDTNESFSYTFDEPGTYRFICSIHPHMVGTIIVR